MSQTNIPKAQTPYDCEAELKKLPHEFWTGVPTAQHIPHRRNVFSQKNESGNYYKKHYSAEAWKMLAENGYRLFPFFCKPNEYDFVSQSYEKENKTNKTFAVYKMPNGMLVKEYCTDFNKNDGNTKTEVCVDNSSTEKIHNPENWIKVYSGYCDKHYELAQECKKQLKKLEEVWNRLRKDARRNAGKEPPAEVAQKQKQTKKQKEMEIHRQKVLLTAKATLQELKNYIATLEKNEVTQEEIYTLYNQMIELSQVNKTYKYIAGAALKNPKRKNQDET